MGTLFLYLGISDFVYPPDPNAPRQTGPNGEELVGPAAWEKLMLGFIMFIPGSYHSFLAFMTWIGQDDYSYHDVSTFENDDFFHDE